MMSAVTYLFISGSRQLLPVAPATTRHQFISTGEEKLWESLVADECRLGLKVEAEEPVCR